MTESDPELPLVTVFRTTDAGLLPLAEIALRGEFIEYTIRRPTTDIRRAYGVNVTDFNNPLDPAEIIVAAAEARRAREVLADLAGPNATVPAESELPDGPAGGEDEEWASMPAEGEPGATVDPHARIALTDGETGMPLGTITGAQLQVLIDRLEEESETSRHYYIDGPTIEMLADQGADPALIDVLRHALGSRPGLEIRWATNNQ
jgi:processive 1,2-diacylglycerol beta-glucosyltransferase